MAILAECPYCHRRQAVKNRNCASCGQDLTKKKRANKVRYWIAYRVNGKQRWEFVGNDENGKPFGIEEARAAEGKRLAQKFENPAILERVSAEKMTFNKLADWYLDIPSVKKLASYKRVEYTLQAFNGVFGERIVSSIKPLDLEAYQHKREEEGRAPATIDMEITVAKTMVTKAFYNDLVDGRTVKAFGSVKRKLKKGSNARKQTLSVEDYLKLCQEAPPHLKAMLTVAYHTGMRLGELWQLKWENIDRENGFIRLSADMTKESRAKAIPLNYYANEVLAQLPRALAHDYVFTYNGKPITAPAGGRKSLKTACKAAVMVFGRDEGVTFHDIRRTVKTNMLSAGVDKVHRDIILGHSLQGMDAHYLAPSEKDLQEAVSKYTMWFEGQIEDVSKTVSENMI